MKLQRLEHVRMSLSELELSHILLTDPITIEYISGFHSSNSMVLISRTHTVLFTDFRYQESALKFCKLNQSWKFILLSQHDYTLLSQFITPGCAVGIQGNYVTVDTLNRWKKALKKVRFISLPNEVIGKAIAAKTNQEIECIASAARIGDKAYKRFVKHIKHGISEIEAARALERFCAEYGSEKPSFDTIVLFGAHASLPHGKPGQKKLKNGDFVLCDFGCTVKGFCSDMTRTIVFGAMTSKQKKIIDIVIKAQQCAKDVVITGVSAKEVDRAARDCIEAAGYGKQYEHSTGHGVGLRIHENPRLHYSSHEVLVQGMVVTIEPGIYIPGFGGVRIEDMVVVTNKGYEILTHSPLDFQKLAEKS